MFQNVVPITKDRHQGKKIKQGGSFEFAGQSHLASVPIHEFPRAASVYPIVFLEDQETSEFRPVALLGLNSGENLFVDSEGNWDASYIPTIIRRYPFALARTDDENRFSLCIDEGSDLVNEEEGEPLFQEEGEPAQVLERAKQYLGELQGMEQVTRRLCQTLKEKYMFTPLNMRVREADSVKNISGAYVINEKKLNDLSDEDFLNLRSENVLYPIYSHLTSIAQTDRLVRLRDQKSK